MKTWVKNKSSNSYLTGGSELHFISTIKQVTTGLNKQIGVHQRNKHFKTQKLFLQFTSIVSHLCRSKPYKWIESNFGKNKQTNNKNHRSH